MNRLGSLFYARGHLRTNQYLQILIKRRNLMTVNKRLQQFAIGLLTVLSLLISSVEGCTCSHHEADGTSEPASHHRHSEMSEAAESHDSHVEDANACLASDADCVCAVPASKFVAKPAGIKLKKQVPTISIKTSIRFAVVRQMDTARVDFVKPFYLSDSFYNLAPKRGPPSL